jgi:hypothetical protein
MKFSGRLAIPPGRSATKAFSIRPSPNIPPRVSLTCAPARPLPVERLQLMDSQIDAMTMALEIVRVPLQKFEQSLDDRQRARFSARVASEDVAPVCTKNPEPANWPMPILKQALQPTAAQEAALNDLERAFNRAASGLNAACSDGMPRMPSARLQAIEARLDITWVAVQTIQVAVAQFQKTIERPERSSSASCVARSGTIT